jgi:hypothetical protein
VMLSLTLIASDLTPIARARQWREAQRNKCDVKT